MRKPFATPLRYRYGTLVALVAIALFFVTPASARALSADAVISGAMELLSSGLAAALEPIVKALEGWRMILVLLIVGLGKIVNVFASYNPINNGGAVVYFVWKMFRDICNSFFIVLFILVAFGTIFRVFWKKGQFYYQSALMNVILAAVLINFSLPIGQTIVWAGNQATQVVTNLMAGNNDIAGLILSKGQLTQVATGNIGQPIDTIPVEGLPDSQKNPVQKIATSAYVGNAKIVLTNCLKGGGVPAECNSKAGRVAAIDAAAATDREVGRIAGSKWSWGQMFSDTYYFWTSAAKGAATYGQAGYTVAGVKGAVIGAAAGAYAGARLGPAKTEPDPGPKEQAWKIISLLLNCLMLIVLFFSFLFFILIMAICFPVVYFYLATSAINFFFIAVPGSTRPREWFGHMIGWSIITPLYLFVIYIAMFVLDKHGTLIADMKNVGFFSGLLAIPFFYALVGAFFLGGGIAAWKFAFSFSKSAEKVFGGVADSMGVGVKDNLGINKLGRLTGVTPYVQGKQAAIQEKYKSKFVTPQLRREEEIRARAQGGKTYENLQRSRIDEQKKKNKEAGKTTGELQAAMASAKPGSPEYFAAASQLLESGDLDAAGMIEYARQANNLNPTYGRVAREQVFRKALDMAKNKKIKDPAEAIALVGMYPVGSKEQADLLSAIKKNQPLLAVDMMASGFYAGENRENILKSNFSALGNKEIVEVVDRMESGRLTKDGEFESLVAGKNRKLSTHLELLAATTDPQIQGHIMNYMNNQKPPIKPKP